MAKSRKSNVAAPALLTQAQIESLGVVDTPPAPETQEEGPKPEVEAEKPSQEPEAPAKPTHVLFVDSPIKKALYDLVLRAEFTKEGGKFAGKAMANLAKPWIDVEIQVAGEGQKVGRNFEAAKGNWNFNDSNYVNPEHNFRRLMAAATEANGGVSIPKKQLVGHLEDLKLICQKMAA